MMKRLLCLLVIAVMVLSVFAGCKKDGPETPGTSGESENTTEPVTNEPEEPKKTWNDLPKTKFDGEEYYILGRQHTPWGSFDLHAADTSTELSAAVFARNSMVEARHGITIKANYDRVYRFIVTVKKDERSVALDTTFGINEAGVAGGGYAVVKVASGLNTEGDSSVAELYGVDVRSDGAVFIGCGNNRTNAVVLSADGASKLGVLYDKNNTWTPNGPIALVEDTYLGVINNKYGGSPWAKGIINVFNAKDLTQYPKTTNWE